MDTSTWKEFRVGDLFPTLVKGKCGDASTLTDGDEVNYIGAKWNDNGVMKSCARSENAAYISNGNCIAMIGQGEGSSGYAIYLDRDFIGATSLNLGYADWITPNTGLFVATILCQEYNKYSFGRSWTGDRLKNTIISLPASPSGEPDWAYMEEFMGGLHSEPLTTSVKSSHIPLKTEKWGEFKVRELFTQERGSESAPNQNEDGSIPIINETDSNNGYVRNVVPTKIYKGNAITISINFASNVFYQPEDFCASVNIAIIRNQYLNELTGLFIASVIRQNNLKYSYGYKISKEKIDNMIIRLPQTSDGKPDWKWMENYMKSLPYSDRVA